MYVFLQIDPLDTLNRERDSSLLLAFEAQRRGYTVVAYPWQTLSCWDGDLSVYGFVLTFLGSAQTWEKGEEKKWSLTQADVLLIRQDPPFDMAYITSTYMLDILQHQNPTCLIVNDPTGIRNNAEKLIPLRFADLMPPTLVSRDVRQVEAFRREHGEVIIKPLYGYAGNNLVRIGQDDTNHAALLELFNQLYKEPFVVQKYLPIVRTHGDKRLVLVDGELIGGFVRIPPHDDIRANTVHGARIEELPLPLSEGDRAICARLGPYLREQGILFAGLDIIGPYLTEVNLTSPGAFYFYDKLYPTTGASQVWDAILRRLSDKTFGKNAPE